MIYDQIGKQSLYRNLHPGFPAAFDYLLSFDPATPDGRVELQGDRLFALVQTYDTTPADQKTYEAHRRYIDLQYVVAGQEIIYHVPLPHLQEATPYIAEKDVARYKGQDEQALVMRAGDFSILFPHDGHKPNCVYRDKETVRKVVLKIAV